VRRFHHERDDQLLTVFLPPCCGTCSTAVMVATSRKNGPPEGDPEELPAFGQAREESVPKKHSHRPKPFG